MSKLKRAKAYLGKVVEQYDLFIKVEEIVFVAGKMYFRGRRVQKNNLSEYEDCTLSLKQKLAYYHRLRDAGLGDERTPDTIKELSSRIDRGETHDYADIRVNSRCRHMVH